MQEIWVLSLGLEDPLEKEIATHSNILAWKIPWIEEPGGLQSMGLQGVRHDLATTQQQAPRCSQCRRSMLHTEEVKSLSRVQLFATLWTVSHKAPLSMGFSRQEYCSGLPCPPPGDLLDPGIEPSSLKSPALAGGFFTTSTTWEAPEGL